MADYPDEERRRFAAAVVHIMGMAWRLHTGFARVAPLPHEKKLMADIADAVRSAENAEKAAIAELPIYSFVDELTQAYRTYSEAWRLAGRQSGPANIGAARSTARENLRRCVEAVLERARPDWDPIALERTITELARDWDAPGQGENQPTLSELGPAQAAADAVGKVFVDAEAWSGSTWTTRRKTTRIELTSLADLAEVRELRIQAAAKQDPGTTDITETLMNRLRAGLDTLVCASRWDYSSVGRDHTLWDARRKWEGHDDEQEDHE